MINLRLVFNSKFSQDQIYNNIRFWHHTKAGLDCKEISNVGEISEAENTNSIEEFDKKLPETVSLLKGPCGSKVYLVGTAHVSKSSQKDVARVIQTVQPHIVVVELCTTRLNVLQINSRMLLEAAKNMNMKKIPNIVREHGFLNGLVGILFLKQSAEFIKKGAAATGGEFRTAFAEACKLNHCAVQLGDRPYEITWQRTLAKLNWMETLKVFQDLMLCEPLGEK